MLPEFKDNYEFKNNSVFRLQDNKEMLVKETAKKAKVLKLKANDGVWKQVPFKKILAYEGLILELPTTAVNLKMCGSSYFIDRNGDIYSFSSKYLTGIKLSVNIGTKGYPNVMIPYRGKTRKRDVHTLLCEAFIKPNYVSEGLVAMHKDDDKLHCHIDNLCLGTYSQNLQDAWDRNRRN